jgi:hypothetical protein
MACAVARDSKNLTTEFEWPDAINREVEQVIGRQTTQKDRDQIARAFGAAAVIWSLRRTER